MPLTIYVVPLYTWTKNILIRMHFSANDWQLPSQFNQNADQFKAQPNQLNQQFFRLFEFFMNSTDRIPDLLC